MSGIKGKGIVAQILSQPPNPNDPTVITTSDINEILSFITKEKELSSKIYKCLEYLQTKFLKNPEVILSVEGLLAEKFSLIIETSTNYLRDYTMSWLIGVFFKIEQNFSIFLEIYFKNLQNEKFKIEEEKAKIYKTNFYYFYSIKSENNFNKILYVYDTIDKKHMAMQRILLFMDTINKYFGFDFVNFILVLMCQKIKNNSNKFDIEKERSMFKFYYQYFFEFNFTKLKPLIHYAFDTNFPISNRKIFLFSILILFTSIGHKCFNDILNYILNNTSEIVFYITTIDLTIMQESISFLYHFLETSKNFQHCFECVVGDLVTCDGEQPAFPLENIEKPDKFEILENFIKCFEKIYSLCATNFQNVYFKIQLLIIKFFEPFKEPKQKIKLDELFMNSKTIPLMINELKAYEIKFPKISHFVNSVNENAVNCCPLYINWYILIFKNFPLFDSYKVFHKFLLQDLNSSTTFPNLLAKLPNELKKINYSVWKRILNSFLVGDTYNSLSNDQIFNLIKNLKNILYYELSQNSQNIINNVFDSLIHNHSEIITFFKNNFHIFTPFFFTHKIISSNTNGMDIDELYDNYMNNKSGDDTEDIYELDTTSSNKKIEILNIYTLLLNSYKSEERIPNSIIKFSLDIIDQLVLSNNPNNSLITHIQKTISIIITIYIREVINEGCYTKIHPIRTIFNKINKHLLIKILKNKNEKQASLYFKYYKSLVISLKQYSEKIKNDKIIQDNENNITYIIKQMIYKNVDSQNFRNPLAIKNMIGLNDIDTSITNIKYIIDVLSLLSHKKHFSFYGFYLRFLMVGSDIENGCIENIIKLIKLLIEINWIPEEFNNLIKILNNKGKANHKKIVGFIVDYLKDHLIEIEFEKKEERKENENDEIRRKNIYNVKFKQIIYENIDLLDNVKL